MNIGAAGAGLITLTLCAALLTGCGSRASDTAKIADAYINSFTKLYEQGARAETLTDEYTVSQKAWKALADGQVKLNVNSCPMWTPVTQLSRAV